MPSSMPQANKNLLENQLQRKDVEVVLLSSPWGFGKQFLK